MMLDDIVSRGRGGPPGQFHDNANGGQNGTVQEIMIPAGKAGLVIGKGGETIKQLQVRVKAPPVPSQDSLLPAAVPVHATSSAPSPPHRARALRPFGPGMTPSPPPPPPPRPRKSLEGSALTSSWLYRNGLE